MMKETAEFFKVLSDEARLRILALLFNHSELCVCDIMSVLCMTQSKTSRHLATLRRAGFVNDRRDGAWSYYSLRAFDDPMKAAVVDAFRQAAGRMPDSAAAEAALKKWLLQKASGLTCCGRGDQAGKE